MNQPGTRQPQIGETDVSTDQEQSVETGGPGESYPHKLLLTAEEVAQALGIGRSKVYELMAAGQLRSVAIGRLRRVPAARLAEFVASLELERS
jgi:excisionase family DNA binding protein